MTAASEKAAAHIRDVFSDMIQNLGDYCTLWLLRISSCRSVPSAKTPRPFLRAQVLHLDVKPSNILSSTAFVQLLETSGMRKLLQTLAAQLSAIGSTARPFTVRNARWPE